MTGEVAMNLMQPELMRQIVDNGVLGLGNGGIGNLDLVWQLGIKMILFAFFGVFCGSMNNVFTHNISTKYRE